METTPTPPADRRCRDCGATSGLRLTIGSPLSSMREWVCDAGCPEPAREPLDLDAIDALTAAASIEPWEAGDDGLVWAPRIGDPVSGSTEVEDARFIAAARTALPRAVAEVRALRAEVDEARTEHQITAQKFIDAQGEAIQLRAANEKLLDHLASLAPGTRRVYDREPAADVTEVYDADGDKWERSGGGWLPLGSHRLTEPVNFPDLRDTWGPISAALPERTAVPGEPVNLATWCRQRAAAYREYEHVEMAAPPTQDDRDTALIEWTVRTLGNPAAPESRQVLNILADRHVDSPEPVARISVPGEPLQPLPDSAYLPSAVSLVLGIPDAAPGNPEAVERELRRVSAETGEPYEIVRDLYDAMSACADEERIEREQHELSLTEFVAFDHTDSQRWWVLRGPAGAVSLTAVIVGDATLPPSVTIVTDQHGHRLAPNQFTAHRPGTCKTCPALPDGCDSEGEALPGSHRVLEAWAAAGNDDDVIRDALVDVYRRELLGGDQ